MGKHEDAESGIKFEREYNQICGRMLQEEREKRGISRLQYFMKEVRKVLVRRT